jgi:hypothetical protein
VTAPDRPRLLFLSPVVPAPLDRGQNVRIHHLVAGLARHFRVTLVVPAGPGVDEESLLWSAVERVITVPSAGRSVPPGQALRFMLRHRAFMRPATVRRLQPFREALDRLPLDQYSAVWVERTGLAILVRKLGRRVLVDLDDLEHRSWVRHVRLHGRAGSGRPLVRALYHAGQMFGREILLARTFGCCAVASVTDAAYLRRWGLRNGAVLPNAASVDATAQENRRLRRSAGGTWATSRMSTPSPTSRRASARPWTGWAWPWT